MLIRVNKNRIGVFKIGDDKMSKKMLSEWDYLNTYVTIFLSS